MSRREVPTPETRCPRCHTELERFWSYCPSCSRRLEWRDTLRETNAECAYCGWMVSDASSFCPWCGRNIEDEDSSDEPLKAPKGFKFHARCDWGCGGGVMYPMRFCPWCGRAQTWRYDHFQNSCPHCDRGVDDWMATCPWCGEDATGGDLIPRALRRARRLLIVSRIRDWHYRVALRPGVSGVAPRAPKVIELDRTRSGRFRRTFGEVRKAYRVADEHWVDFERRRIATTLTDYVSAYAATHPQEDFAETFRFYVARRGRLRELFAEFGRKRKGVRLYEKFLVLHDFVRSLRGWK